MSNPEASVSEEALMSSDVHMMDADPSASRPEGLEAAQQNHSEKDFSMGVSEGVDKKRNKNKKKRNKNKKRKKLRLRDSLKETDYNACHGELPEKPTMLTLDFYLEPRIDVTMDIPRRLDTIHMYGIDLMGTRDIFAYLKGFQPKTIEWINDSSCNVQLEHEDNVRDVLMKLGRPVWPEDTPKNAVKDNSFRIMYLWYRACPFLKGRLHEKVHLMLRMATIEDVRPHDAPTISRKLWLKETDEASRNIRQHYTLDHENAAAALSKNKREKRRPPSSGFPNKMKVARREKPEPKPKDESGEMEAVPSEENNCGDSNDVAKPSSSTLAASSMLPPDLRDFIGKLRAQHGIPQ